MRVPAHPGRYLAVGIPVIGLFVALAPAAGASTAGKHAAASSHKTVISAATRKAAARKALEELLARHPDLARQDSPAAAGAVTQVTSTAWSGYAVTGTGFTSVSASWTEPALNCSGNNGVFSNAAFWIGIDGVSSDTEEQVGTMGFCLLGTPQYSSWWNMPDGPVVLSTQPVNAGDVITASVVRTGSSYALTVTDSTSAAGSFSVTQTCADCVNSSAEWIAEGPDGYYGLADFGAWDPSGAGAGTASVSGTISAFPDEAITMVSSSGSTDAVPSALDTAGDAFDDAWNASS